VNVIFLYFLYFTVNSLFLFSQGCKPCIRPVFLSVKLCCYLCDSARLCNCWCATLLPRTVPHNICCDIVTLKSACVIWRWWWWVTWHNVGVYLRVTTGDCWQFWLTGGWECVCVCGLCDWQVVEDGYEFFAKRQLVTLFSAPNYCGEFDNAGAMMSVDETLMCSFQVSPHCCLCPSL